MNIVKLFEELKLNSLMKEQPINFILFNEISLERFSTFNIEKYKLLLNRKIVDKYFNDELEITDLIEHCGMEKLELLQVIIERLEYIKSLDLPEMTIERKSILKAILNSNNIFIALPNREKTIHKYELITFLSLINWDSYGIINTFGWDFHYTSMEFEFDPIFNIGKLEVHLPQNEMKLLYENLPKLKFNETSKGISDINEIYSERNKEIFASLFL